MVKNLPAVLERKVEPLSGTIPRRRKWQVTPVFLPWTEEPGGLQSMGLPRVWHDRVTEQQQPINSHYIKN